MATVTSPGPHLLTVWSPSLPSSAPVFPTSALYNLTFFFASVIIFPSSSQLLLAFPFLWLLSA